MPHTPTQWLALVHQRDAAQARFHAAFREERRLRIEHTCAAQELEFAKAAYSATIKAVREAEIAPAMAVGVLAAAE